MTNADTLSITLPGDREIAFTREFDAPRRLVFDAYTKPELIRRWLLGPGGWTMPVCEVDLRVGGAYRYAWEKTDLGLKMGMGGKYLEIVAPETLVCTEKFDDPWYEGEATSRIEFTEQHGKTTMTLTIRYASKDVRDAVLKSPMESGMRAGYDALAQLLTTL